MNVHAQTAIMPYMQRELPPAMQMPLQKSSGFNTMLQIGQSLIGGAKTYMSLAAKPAGDVGGGDGGKGTGTGSGSTTSSPFNYSAFKNPGNFNIPGLDYTSGINNMYKFPKP